MPRKSRKEERLEDFGEIRAVAEILKKCLKNWQTHKRSKKRGHLRRVVWRKNSQRSCLHLISQEKMRRMEGVGIICVCVRERNRMVVVVVGSWAVRIIQRHNAEAREHGRFREPGVIIFKEGEAINADIDQGSSSYKWEMDRECNVTDKPRNSAVLLVITLCEGESQFSHS